MGGGGMLRDRPPSPGAIRVSSRGPGSSPAFLVTRARAAGCRRERARPWDPGHHAGRGPTGRRAAWSCTRCTVAAAAAAAACGACSAAAAAAAAAAAIVTAPLGLSNPPTPSSRGIPPNSSILWHALLSAPFPRFNSCATLSSPLIFVLSPVPAGAGASLSPNPFPSSSPFSPLLSLPHLPDSISLPPPHRLSICLNVSLSLNLFLSLASSLGFCPSPLTFQRPLIPRLSRPFHSPTPGFAEARGAPKTAPLAEMLKPHMYMRTAAWAQISPRRRREARVFASHSARIYRREMKWGLRKGLVAAVRLKTTSVSFGVKRSFPYLLIPCCSRSFPTSSFLVAHLAPSY